MNILKFLGAVALAFLFIAPAALWAQEKQIEKIIVRGASLSPLALKHLSSTITILTAHDIAASGQPFLIDVLRRVPGIGITQSGGAGALGSVRIRGGESDHTKVLINGIEVNDTSSAQFDFGHLSSSQIERIEIIRGSQSLIHGANATGGIIAITTKIGGKTSKDDISGDYQADGGSFGTWHGAANFGGGGENFSFGGGLDIYNSDGHDVSSFGSDEKDAYRNFTAYMRSDWTQDNFKARFSLRHSSDRFNYDPSGFSSADISDGADYNLSQTKQTEAGIGASHDWALMETLANRLNFHNEVNFSLLYLERDVTDLSRDQRLNVHYKTGLGYGDLVDLTLLLGWEEEELNTDIDYTEIEQFVALESQVYFLGFDLTAGVRGEFYNNSENGVLWRVTAARDLPAMPIRVPVRIPIRVHGSYGTGINKPTLYDLYGFFPESYCPNPALKPEDVNSWDIGLDFDLAPFIEGLTFGAIAFGLDIEDEFQGVFNSDNTMPPRAGCPAETTSSIVNDTGRSKRRGAELQADWQVLDDLFLSAHYTYTRAKRSDGAQSLRRPKNIWGLNVVWTIGAFSLGGDMVWTSKQQDISATDFSVITTASHFLFNLHGSYGLAKKLDIFLRLDNITGEKTTIDGFERRGFGAYAGIKGRF